MIILYSSPTKHYLDEYSPSVRTKVGTGTCTQDSITHDYCMYFYKTRIVQSSFFELKERTDQNSWGLRCLVPAIFPAQSEDFPWRICTRSTPAPLHTRPRKFL